MRANRLRMVGWDNSASKQAPTSARWCSSKSITRRLADRRLAQCLRKLGGGFGMVRQRGDEQCAGSQPGIVVPLQDFLPA